MKYKIKKIVFLVSGNGNNMKYIFEEIKNGNLYNFKINLVISDRNCGAIQYALKNNIKSIFLNVNKKFLSKKINNILIKDIPYIIVLSGFLSTLDEKFCKKWSKKTINIHPSLLPKYGGKGMYGIRVHKKVIENKEKESGATVHYVTKNLDSGKIIIKKSCRISLNETPISLSKKISILEKKILIHSIKNF